MKFRKIENLEDIYRDYAQEGFLESAEQQFIPTDYADINITHVTEKPDGDEFDYEGLKTIIFSEIKNDKVHYSTDYILARKVHQFLSDNGMTRKIAGDMNIWHYMSFVEFKNYVTARWGELNVRPAVKNRYFGRIGRNAISRLWLWADLTVIPSDDGSYNTTTFPFNQNVPNFALETDMPMNRPLFRILCEFIRDEIQENPHISDNEGAIKALFPKTRILNTTRKLSILDKDGIYDYLKSFTAPFVKL